MDQPAAPRVDLPPGVPHGPPRDRLRGAEGHGGRRLAREAETRSSRSASPDTAKAGCWPSTQRPPIRASTRVWSAVTSTPASASGRSRSTATSGLCSTSSVTRKLPASLRRGRSSSNTVRPSPSMVRPRCANGRRGAAAGKIQTPAWQSVRNEFARLEKLVPGDFQPRRLLAGADGAPIGPGSRKRLRHSPTRSACRRPWRSPTRRPPTAATSTRAPSRAASPPARRPRAIARAQARPHPRRVLPPQSPARRRSSNARGTTRSISRATRSTNMLPLRGRFATTSGPR